MENETFMAYFIGGPEDMTKRVINNAPPYFEFAQMEGGGAMRDPRDYCAVVRRVVYRLFCVDERSNFTRCIYVPENRWL